MFLCSWRDIGSPNLNQSPTTLKAYDECRFKPYGILNSLAMELGGKTISIDVEVVNAPLDYNLLLLWSWFYVMTFVAFPNFLTLQFPHQGKYFIIDQLEYCTPNIHNHGTNNVPFVEDSKLSYESVGVGLLKDFSLMGTFPLSSPNPPHQASTINAILTLSQWSSSSYDPRVVPSPSEIASSFPVSHDPIPFPSSSSGAHIMTSTHKLQRTNGKGARHRKWKTNKKYLATRHHVGHTPLASANHVEEKYQPPLIMF